MAILPAVVLVALIVLTSLGVSGSSVGWIAGPERWEDGVALGAPRAIRSDEWNVRTPLVVGQYERGLPNSAEVGVGDHDLSVLYDLPSSDVVSLLRPNLWGYWVLPLDNAFALDWWGLAAILILGTYTLVLSLTRDWRWAALVALAAYASPFFHWWYLGVSLALTGWVALAVGLFLLSLRTPTPWKRWVGVAGAGYALAALVTTAYPPFQIPVTLAIGPVALAITVYWLVAGDTSLRRVVVNGAAVGAVAVAGIGAYLVANADALAAISNTVYPGNRRAVSGTGVIEHLGSAWFGWLWVRDPDVMNPVILGNSSEASSFLTLGVFLLAALPPVWRHVAGPSSPWRWPIIAAVTSLIVLLIHGYVGLPPIAAQVLLLDRVPPTRAIAGIGIGSLLLVALVGVALADRPPPRWRRLLAGGILTGTLAIFVVGVGQTIRDQGAPLGRVGFALTLIVVVVVAGTWFWRPLVSVTLLVMAGLVFSVPANPLQVGLTPLRPEPLVGDLQAAGEGIEALWLSGDPLVSTVITGTGAGNLSGVNLYPDAAAWRTLDPSGQFEQAWNRYSNTAWILTPGLPEPIIEALAADVLSIRIDPCDSGLAQLGVTNIVSTEPLDAPCLSLDRTSSSPTGSRLFLYDVVR